MYTPSNYVHPQIYQDPNQSAIVTPPNGWGVGPAPGVVPHKRGIGLFDSADWTTWGIAEWAIIAVGAYLVISLFNDIGSGVTTVKRARRRRRRKVEAEA